jgi:hypothetical protein
VRVQVRPYRSLLVVAIFVLTALTANAVYELVVIAKPFNARSVSGVIMDPIGEPLAGAEVKDYDREFSNVLDSTATDDHGYFVLPTGGRSVHYLRIYARGMNPLQITIAVRQFARLGVRVKLHIGG